MKQFRFRLSRILKYQQQRRRQAELHQQQIQQRLEAAHAQVATIDRRLSDSRGLLDDYLGQPTHSGVWTTSLQHVVRIDHALEQAKQAARQVASELAKADEHRASVTTEEEALQILRRQQWEKHRRKAEQVAQEQIDELAVRKWKREKDAR